MARLPRRVAPVALVALVALASCARDTPPAPESPPAPQVEVLARGSHFRGTNGIYFGPDGLLYVASVVTPALAAIDPESGEIRVEWGAAEGAKGPDDLAFGPDGSIYWTDISFGDVVRRSPDGTVATIASLGAGVNPITFSDDGRLFVSQCFMGDKLFEVDPEGKKEPRLISDQLGPGCGLNGMDWGPDGKLYGPRWFQGTVARVDVDTGKIETAADGFGVPAAVKFDAQGRLHVLDSLRGEVVRVSLGSGEREVVGRVPPSTADNLAFDSSGRLFVSSFGDGFIVEVLGPDSTRTVLPGGINMPGGLALARAGAGTTDDDGGEGGREVLYVADFFALRGLDPATGDEVYAAHDIIGFSQLGSSMSVAAWDDKLVTTSWFDNAVRVWDPASDQVTASYAELKRPVFARPFEGDLVVSEWDTGSVLRLKGPAPEDRSAIATGLASPAGLAARGGDLWVADRDSGRILQILAGGEVLSPPREVVRGLQGPEGIEIDDEGVLYVVEAEGDRLSRVDPATGEVSAVAEGLALGKDRIYVNGDVENVIYSIAR